MTEDDVATDLPDLTDVPLEQLAADDGEEALRRVAPEGGQLLVAASFNSAI